MLFLSKWKWYIIGFLFVIYSAGIWHVSSTYATASMVKAELERIQSNNQLATDISKKLDNDKAEYTKAARQATKEMLDELLKDPRYKSCRTTDSVRDAIQRKLDAQPK